MLGSTPQGQSELIFAGSLRDFVPDDHVLARVDRVLDLSWLRAEVRDRYARRRATGREPQLYGRGLTSVEPFWRTARWPIIKRPRH